MFRSHTLRFETLDVYIEVRLYSQNFTSLADDNAIQSSRYGMSVIN